jgi:Tat protein translocase TatB subunit
MFDLSFGEILLVVVIAVIFIGPKDMPVVLRAVARGMRQVKSLSGELKKAFDELADESGLKEAQADIDREMRKITGDDGEEYEAYDISDLLPPRENAPEKKEP